MNSYISQSRKVVFYNIAVVYGELLVLHFSCGKRWRNFHFWPAGFLCVLHNFLCTRSGNDVIHVGGGKWTFCHLAPPPHWGAQTRPMSWMTSFPEMTPVGRPDSCENLWTSYKRLSQPCVITTSERDQRRFTDAPSHRIRPVDVGINFGKHLIVSFTMTEWVACQRSVIIEGPQWLQVPVPCFPHFRFGYQI